MMDGYEDDEWVDSDFEDESRTAEKSGDYKPSYVLIAIDTDKSMFEDVGSEEFSFLAALNSCYEIINSLILSDHQSKGPVGIVLADNNVAKSNLIEFEQTIPDTIKLLKHLKEQTKDYLQFKYERKQNFDLADFFLLCKNKLLSIKTDVYKRIIIYVTNDDNPVQNDPKKRFKIINESQKFPSIQIELVVVTLNPNFDNSHLYSELLSASGSTTVDTVSQTTLTKKLENLINKKRYTRKCSFYPFMGNTESYFEVTITNPTSASTIRKNAHVTRDAQKEVKKTIRQQTGGTYKCLYSKKEEPLILDEIEKQNLGENSLPVGYTLVYVAESILKPGWVLKPPYLMEKHPKEALQLFESFWQFCRDKGKCLVCYQKLKMNGDLRFVELIPKFINGSRQFLVKILPFGSEIHYNPVTSTDSYNFSEEEEQAMESMIESLTFNYTTDCFQDPIESKKQAYIKSQLLSEDMEKINDGTVSDDVIDERISESVAKLHALNLFEAASKKRPRNSNGSKSRKK
ncbi:hypothetical protein FQR65_LT13697 [Abscondita terminalis]|nr:hypothetical protein FQR65_LT13697 [Abscondita terminalis]